MKKLFNLITALVVSVLTSSCFSWNSNAIYCNGEIKSVDMDFKDFSEVVVNGAADLHISQEDNFSVRVVANEEVFQHLDYKVEDGTLILQTKERVQIRAEKFDVFVTMPAIETLGVNGASDAVVSDFSGDYGMTVTVNGAGDVELKNLTLEGLTFTVNGAADLVARELDVKKVNVAVNGAADASLQGKAEDVEVSIAGAGSIDIRSLFYTHLSTHKAGAASILTQ
jgi:hypothetical protein